MSMCPKCGKVEENRLTAFVVCQKCSPQKKKNSFLQKHFKYASYVVRHKWFVFVECVKLGIPLRGLLHDLSKLTPSEWFAYVEYFYGEKNEKTEEKFDLAWVSHQHRNPHHWQHWLLREDSGSPLMKAVRRVLTDAAQDDIESGSPCNLQRGPEKDYVHIVRSAINQLSEAVKTEGFKVFEMPLDVRKEMLADWIGAGRAQGKKNQPAECAAWYRQNRDKMVLGTDTRLWIEMKLGLYKE